MCAKYHIGTIDLEKGANIFLKKVRYKGTQVFDMKSEVKQYRIFWLLARKPLGQTTTEGNPTTE